MPINPEKLSKNYLFEYMLMVLKKNTKALDPATGLPSIVKFFNFGGTRCFYESQKIITNNGVKKISDVSKNDMVLSFNEESKISEYKKVLDVIKTSNHNKKCLKITFKNGEVIKCTEDHKIYYKGRYVCAKDLVKELENSK